jgi:hypothetical protein
MAVLVRTPVIYIAGANRSSHLYGHTSSQRESINSRKKADYWLGPVIFESYLKVKFRIRV